MKTSNLNELFAITKYKLPYIEAEDTKSFIYHFANKTDEYIKELNDIPEEAFGSFNKRFFINDISYLANSLKQTLILYLNGFPSKAYSTFKKTINRADFAPELMYWRKFELDSGTKLYRTKKEFQPTSDKYKNAKNGFGRYLERIDLFHVPFEKRRSIGTNRFSINGFPSLYVSESLHTSWSEATTNSNDAFHAVCLKNHRPLYIVDLVPLCLDASQRASELNQYPLDNDNEVLLNYAFLYPLVLACHSKIKYIPAYPGEIQFKSEYIIPQLLMQWYREHSFMIDGIRYLSCTAEDKFPKVNFSKYNYVLPVIECNAEEGYCKSLKINFSCTEVYTLLNVHKATITMLNNISNTLDKNEALPL